MFVCSCVCQNQIAGQIQTDSIGCGDSGLSGVIFSKKDALEHGTASGGQNTRFNNEK